MSEEQKMILQMVAEKRITPEEAARLLQQLRPDPDDTELVELDALNLLRLGFDALAEQIGELVREPSLSQRWIDLRDRVAETQRISPLSIDPKSAILTRTEQMKDALAEMIRRAEALNASLDEALKGRREK